MSECIRMEYKAPWHVRLTYFKPSGKYYTEGSYISNKLYMYQIYEEVYEMLKSGKRPGLVDGVNEYFVVMEVPDHPHDCPYLIVPASQD